MVVYISIKLTQEFGLYGRTLYDIQIVSSNLGRSLQDLPIPEKTDDKSFYHFFPMKQHRSREIVFVHYDP